MNMHNIWSKRFAHYMSELQKYMQYIFTGHIAVVLVFVLSALAYQYSDWLKVAPESFPAETIVAIIIAVVLIFSKATTLLREPDQVYLLPLETQMKTYFNKALKWTFFSQVLLPVVLYIVAIPLFRTVTELTLNEIWIGLAFVVVLKLLNVLLDFQYRYLNRGQALFVDKLVRLVLNFFTLYSYLTSGFISGALFVIITVLYYMIFSKKMYVDPIPYEHFVRIEQNRMMAFYRFANYFTDVPHLRGSIKRRAWLDFTLRSIEFNKENAQKYLVARTFIRTDDTFYLWIRLTAISGVFAAFIELQIVTWIVSAALSFAAVIQLKQALNSKGEFRMDHLYPGDSKARSKAVGWLIIRLVILQAIIVMLCNIMMPVFYITPIIIIFVGLITLRLSK